MFVVVSMRSRLKGGKTFWRAAAAGVALAIIVLCLCWLGEKVTPAPKVRDPIKEKPLRVELCSPLPTGYNMS